MSLMDTINKLNNENNTSTNDAGLPNPYDALVHNRALQVNKKNPKLVVRILPPTGDNAIFAEYRRWFTTYQTKTGGSKFTSFVLGAQQDPEDPLEAHINELDAAGKLLNSFGNKNFPSRRYLFNVVPYHFDQATGLTMITDENGLPDVYVMDLSKTQTIELMNNLQEPMNNPNMNPQLIQQAGFQPTQSQVEYSFASSGLGYAVYLVWEKNGSAPVTYKQQVMTQYPLAPLPQGWETKLADLNSLTLPTYKQNRSFVDWIISQDNSLNAVQPKDQPASDPFSGFNANSLASQMPSGMGVEDTHTVSMPAQPQKFSAPLAPTAPVAPAPAPKPVAPTPVAPVAPSQPASNPLAGFGTVAQKTPQAAPTAPQQAPAAPKVPADLNSSVADILSSVPGLEDLDINL